MYHVSAQGVYIIIIITGKWRVHSPVGKLVQYNDTCFFVVVSCHPDVNKHKINH